MRGVEAGGGDAPRDDVEVIAQVFSNATPERSQALNPKTMIAAAFACLALSLSAQVEVPAPEQMSAWLAGYQTLCGGQSPLADHARRLANATDKQKANAYRVARDATNASALVHYTVPPMSETQYLPDAYPFDGEPGKPVRIVAAQNEYEPGSFVVYPLRSFGKVAFAVGDLKTAGGQVFPKAELDLKVIKVWYQNGNGWYSYFQDPGLKLCPELLLNDEDLIKVDTRKVANYARLTEADGAVSYRWITPPRAIDNRIEDAAGYRLDESFCAMKPNFRDAATFQGATLDEGAFKQFFLTAHATEKQAPGLYTGAITVSKDGAILGRIPVELRVLPFVLPKPKTYADANKDFLVFFCEYISFELIRQINGNDQALAEKQLVSLLKNFARHNEVMPNYREAFSRPDISQAAGLDTSTFVTTSMLLGRPADMKYDARRKKAEHLRKFGKAEGYFATWGDEYGLGTLNGIRPMIDIYKNEGFKFTINSRHGYSAGAYLADLFWPPVNPDFGSSLTTSKLNALGGDAYFGWYACQHVGVENPAFIRRQYGLAPYRAGFSCHFNYAHHLNGYNDVRGDTYKSMNFVYGDGNGVLDTLAWEAFREGMDDIRYATCLQQLAHPLVKAPALEARYAAKKALQLLADMNTDAFDLTTARLEMIRHILTLQTFSH